MRPQPDRDTCVTPAQDLRAHVSGRLGKPMKPAHAQDMRMTCARQFTVARVVGVRLGAHLPHNTHPAMSFAIDVWARQPTWEASCASSLLSEPRRCIRANGYGLDHSWVHLPVLGRVRSRRSSEELR
jgi:hypothetical protein